MKGEMMVAIRAAMEHQPMAVLLITVGKSSDVTEYTTQKAAVTPNFPIISKTTATVVKSRETRKKFVHIVAHNVCKHYGPDVSTVLRYHIKHKCIIDKQRMSFTHNIT